MWRAAASLAVLSADSDELKGRTMTIRTTILAFLASLLIRETMATETVAQRSKFTWTLKRIRPIRLPSMVLPNGVKKVEIRMDTSVSPMR